MRMELYKVVITRPNRRVTGYIVSPGEERAKEIVVEHEIALNQENEGFTIERVDDKLPAGMQEGLDGLLEYAPVGFASYCEPIGWLPHAVSVQRLSLFRVEEHEGDTHFVVAADQNSAAAIYCGRIWLEEGEGRLFRIDDALVGLSNEALRNLPALLDVGPVGMVDWDDDRGWFMVD